MAQRTYFAAADVERLIPRLERILTDAIQLRATLRMQEATLERAGVPLTREALQADVPGEPHEVRHAKALSRGCCEALGEKLSEVDRLGGQVKDLDQGLVDFPGKRGTKDICLCWKLGEKRIEYWHHLKDGFAGRRRLDDRVAQEPSRLN
jgi:hypothetical protein